MNPKLILGLMLFLFKINVASAAFSETLAGVWEGTGKQNNGSEWSIRFTSDSRNFSIEYPSIPCGGSWQLLSETQESATFLEHIQVGLDRCINEGTVTLSQLEPDKLRFDYAKGDSTSYGELVRTSYPENQPPSLSSPLLYNVPRGIPTRQIPNEGCWSDSFDVLNCGNGFDSAAVEFSSLNETHLSGARSLIQITFMPSPTNERPAEAYNFKLVMPVDLKLTSIAIDNSGLITDKQSFAGLKTIGFELLDRLYDNLHLGFYLELFLDTIQLTPVGDPSYLDYVQDNYLLLNDGFYPYIAYDGSFGRPELDQPSRFLIYSAQPFPELMSLIGAHGMSIYIGAHPSNEVLIERLSFVP